MSILVQANYCRVEPLTLGFTDNCSTNWSTCCPKTDMRTHIKHQYFQWGRNVLNALLPWIIHTVPMFTTFGLCVPGYTVSGGCGVLALQDSPPPSDADGAGGWLILTELIHTGLPGHVEPHGLLVVAVNTLSGWHITLKKGECYYNL